MRMNARTHMHKKDPCAKTAHTTAVQGRSLSQALPSLRLPSLRLHARGRGVTRRTFDHLPARRELNRGGEGGGGRGGHAQVRPRQTPRRREPRARRLRHARVRAAAARRGLPHAPRRRPPRLRDRRRPHAAVRAEAHSARGAAAARVVPRLHGGVARGHLEPAAERRSAGADAADRRRRRPVAAAAACRHRGRRTTRASRTLAPPRPCPHTQSPHNCHALAGA